MVDSGEKNVGSRVPASVGYAAARDTPMIGLHTDWRRRFDDEVVNLMIQCSLDAIVQSLEELRESLLAGSR